MATITHIEDDFNRADSSTTLGTSSSGHAWTANRGTWGISGNAAYQPVAGSPGVATVDLGDKDGRVGFTITAGTAEAWATFRWLDFSNSWFVGNVVGSKYQLVKRVSGTQTTVDTSTTTNVTVGDVVVVYFQGDSITLYVNDVLTDVSATSSDNTGSTNSRVGLRTGSGTSTRFDTFFADSGIISAPGVVGAAVTLGATGKAVGANAESIG